MLSAVATTSRETPSVIGQTPCRQPNLAQRCPLSRGIPRCIGSHITRSILCECLHPACRSTVQLSVEQFRDVREADKPYAIVTGHPTMNGEHPVEVEGDVTIVQMP